MLDRYIRLLQKELVSVSPRRATTPWRIIARRISPGSCTLRVHYGIHVYACQRPRIARTHTRASLCRFLFYLFHFSVAFRLAASFPPDFRNRRSGKIAIRIGLPDCSSVQAEADGHVARCGSISRAIPRARISSPRNHPRTDEERERKVQPILLGGT